MPIEPGLLALGQSAQQGAAVGAVAPDAAALLDSLDEPAWLVDAAGQRVVWVNTAASVWLGGTQHEHIGRDAADMLPILEDAAFWAEVRASRQDLAPAGPVARLVSDAEIASADGRVAQVTRRIVALGGPDQIQGYLVQLHDRSVEVGHARERETLLAELRATLEATADGILVLDTAGRIRAFNRRFAALWELPEAALAERDDAAVLDWMAQAVMEPKTYQQRLDEIGAQMLLSATDQVALINGTLLERHTQPQWSAGRPIGRVYSFRQLAGALRTGALRDDGQRGNDSITGWPNRPAFLALVDEAADQAREEGAPLALLCVEFDRQALFAADGSARARATGELLEGLRACVREDHQMARLGGARFAILLRRSGEAGAEQLADRLVALACQPVHGMLATEGLPVRVGLAVYPQAGRCADELLAHAEEALQHVRADGRSSWRAHQLAGQVSPESRRVQRLELAVREGLAGQAFRLHYQPRLDAASGRIEAVEALLRWQDPEDGLLLPAQFLPLADRAGWMPALDDWALEQALHQAARWRDAGMTLQLTVNVSGASLSQPAYARRVAALLESTGWPARQLELDLTEPALQRDADAALCNLQALSRMGVRLILDDWGSGESALAVLRRFPLSAVKIDRSVLRLVPQQRAESLLVQALMAMAAALGLEVYAEGVETEAQRAFVVEAGCSGWQGLLCSPARERRSVERLLQADPSVCAAQAGRRAASA